MDWIFNGQRQTVLYGLPLLLYICFTVFEHLMEYMDTGFVCDFQPASEPIALSRHKMVQDGWRRRRVGRGGGAFAVS